jgi:glutamate--cysteine ligase
MGPDQWRDHLSTLFPEVRPRGYFEVRTADALPPEWYAAPLVFLAGLVLDEENAATIPMLLSAPSTTGLARAGRVGLRDDEMAKLSSHLAHRALGGCRRLGREFADARDLEAAESFFQRFTWRGLSPSAEAAGIVPV